MTPVFIVARDRLSHLRRTIASLSRLRDVDIHIVDHGTTHAETLEWLAFDCPWTVHYAGNRRVHDLWTDEDNFAFRRIAGDRQPYVVTDPDVDLSRCPENLIELCLDVLSRYPGLSKVGPGLALDDLPDTPLAAKARAWETQFWQSQLEPNLYDAPIDTTFAVYQPLRRRPNWSLSPAARLGYPNVARHLPWYELLLNDELRYYRDHAREGSSHWNIED